jgi:hypothetical protein
MSSLNFVCIYLDINTGTKFRADIEADFVQLDEVESEGANFLSFYKKDVHKKDTSSLVFSIHEYRVISWFAVDFVSISEVAKGSHGVKQSIKLVKAVEE